MAVPVCCTSTSLLPGDLDLSNTWRQRAVMAPDREWERIGHAAQAVGIEIFRFMVQRALMLDSLPPVQGSMS